MGKRTDTHARTDTHLPLAGAVGPDTQAVAAPGSANGKPCTLVHRQQTQAPQLGHNLSFFGAEDKDKISGIVRALNRESKRSNPPKPPHNQSHFRAKATGQLSSVAHASHTESFGSAKAFLRAPSKPLACSVFAHTVPGRCRGSLCGCRGPLASACGKKERKINFEPRCQHHDVQPTNASLSICRHE